VELILRDDGAEVWVEGWVEIVDSCPIAEAHLKAAGPIERVLDAEVKRHVALEGSTSRHRPDAHGGDVIQ
jgi:hypothetical protein